MPTFGVEVAGVGEGCCRSEIFATDTLHNFMAVHPVEKDVIPISHGSGHALAGEFVVTGFRQECLLDGHDDSFLVC